MVERNWLLALILFFIYQTEVFADQKQNDLISSLPGLTFELNFNQYSGYFNLSTGSQIQYWLIESQNDSLNDPLLLWLGGGPACSGLSGIFEEFGPFHPNVDGETLFENIFSWNKVANILFIETPQNIGYSYNDASNENSTYNDEMTTQENFEALIQFVERFPEYKNRDFYITGQSYAGVFVPLLTLKVIQAIEQNTSTLPLNLVGMSVGNGLISSFYQLNSYINLAFYRGIIGIDQYESLIDCCPFTPGGFQYCNFSSFLIWDQHGNGQPQLTLDLKHDLCAINIAAIGEIFLWSIPHYFPYNINEKCYSTDFTNLTDYNLQQRNSNLWSLNKNLSDSPIISDGVWRFVDQGSLINTKSTDSFMGFQCYASSATTKYLNSREARDAIHIPSGLSVNWTECNNNVHTSWIHQNLDMEPVFKQILESNYTLKILIYNGDVDSVCNFLGAEWFVENLAQKYALHATANRSEWMYQQQPGLLQNVAGFAKKFSNQKGNMQIDLLTVKGAGHQVPQDRPGPSLAMISNFLTTNRNYSAPFAVSLNPKPLLSQYQPNPYQYTRKMADKIYNLPGLTFKPSFNHSSGYLQGAVEGNYLHYWLVESQNDSLSDPLVLWLQGGPGCSSLGALLTEHGPFHPNPDGITLFENIFSWNKVANIIYLESPRAVGFSYQNMSASNDTTYDDDKSAADVVAAIKEFFDVYPEYSGREFYITGESYAGVYVPTTARLLIKQIESKIIDPKIIDFRGISIGNGALSAKWDISTVADFMYFHGLLGKNEWDRLRECCAPQNEIYCNITKYLLPNGTSDGSECGNLAMDLEGYRRWAGDYDVYNVYQDCYGYAIPSFGSLEELGPEKFLKRSYSSAIVDQMERMNYRSTDSNGGFQCYMSNAATTYLNQDCVRKALHIPDYVQPWQICRKASDFHYHKIYNSNTSVDLTPVFQDIINSDYVQNNSNPFRILIYNGDVDLASGFLQAEYFVKNLVDINSNVKVVKNRVNWYYQTPGSPKDPLTTAGFIKRFDFNTKVSLDLLTVQGAGHMVPIDKPGPALQMFYNFIQKTGNYDTPLPQKLKRETLVPEFKPPPILANSRNTSTSGTTINILTSTPETTNNILITSTYETTINTSTISTSEPMINTSITSTSETKTNSSTFSTKEPMTSPNCAYMHTNGLNGLMALLLLKIFI